MPCDAPVRICSHKRSGTHLLAASIHLNFELPDVSLKAPVHAGKRFAIGEESWMPGARAPVPWGKLWASHNFYNPTWAKEPEKILYILRHPVPTLISYWRFMDPQEENDPEMYLGKARMKFWLRHVRGYTRNCKWVRYEDLVGERHDEVLSQIGGWFGLKRRRGSFRRVKEHVGWYSDVEPVHDKNPTVDLVKEFMEFFPSGILGYRMSDLKTYDAGVTDA